MKVQRDGRRFTVDVVTDGGGSVSHADPALLAEAADRLGLTAALSRALTGMRELRGRHDPGHVRSRPGGDARRRPDCVADLRAVRDQQVLFGPVASDATAFRVIDAIASDPALLDSLRAARAAARENAWNDRAAPERIVIDIDATLIDPRRERGRSGHVQARVRVSHDEPGAADFYYGEMDAARVSPPVEKEMSRRTPTRLLPRTTRGRTSETPAQRSSRAHRALLPRDTGGA